MDRLCSHYRAAAVTPDEIARKRARLGELDAALTRLRAQHDLLMNAFKFDEARALVASIEAAERERTALAETVPALPTLQSTPYTVARRRRR
jgi:hypothetical protein